MKDLDDLKNDILFDLGANRSEGLFLLDLGTRNNDEIAGFIIQLARRYGFFAYDETTFKNRLPDPSADDYSEMLGYLMDEAIEYLSNGVPDGYWIGNDGYAGGFGIWKCEE